MAKINSKNNDLLHNSKLTTTPKVYAILLHLVNDNREDLAQIAKRVDYLILYTTRCISLKDFKEAKEAIEKAGERIQFLKKEGVEIDYLEYLYEGTKKKLK
ncbi:hypothetical protein J1C67_06450 [Clostridium gasigenes]|uniref:hypothetical protein n=1 Tax=Clostridium gasigenes TaxID=94869 RepID=UPI0014383A6B|nr:hypothetical protein [Clostridium gasigenes]NKF08271.1 hypothetical protein [Clostridium gasigenes]QSW20776.1 hypothetical protein J1C67_06450 [Clostridium gasigenes]